MRIKTDTYLALLNRTPLYPPEYGALLGGTHGIVTTMFLDSGCRSDAGVYEPDCDQLNHTIELWSKEGIEFLGIAHSHNGETLSRGDCIYIEQIMLSMPTHKNVLYFPVINPRKCIAAHKAVRNSSSIIIDSDDMILIS